MERSAATNHHHHDHGDQEDHETTLLIQPLHIEINPHPQHPTPPLTPLQHINNLNQDLENVNQEAVATASSSSSFDVGNPGLGIQEQVVNHHADEEMNSEYGSTGLELSSIEEEGGASKSSVEDTLPFEPVLQDERGGVTANNKKQRVEAAPKLGPSVPEQQHAEGDVSTKPGKSYRLKGTSNDDDDLLSKTNRKAVTDDDAEPFTINGEWHLLQKECPRSISLVIDKIVGLFLRDIREHPRTTSKIFGGVSEMGLMQLTNYSPFCRINFAFNLPMSPEDRLFKNWKGDFKKATRRLEARGGQEDNGIDGYAGDDLDNANEDNGNQAVIPLENVETEFGEGPNHDDDPDGHDHNNDETGKNRLKVAKNSRKGGDEVKTCKEKPPIGPKGARKDKAMLSTSKAVISRTNFDPAKEYKDLKLKDGGYVDGIHFLNPHFQPTVRLVSKKLEEPKPSASSTCQDLKGRPDDDEEDDLGGRRKASIKRKKGLESSSTKQRSKSNDKRKHLKTSKAKTPAILVTSSSSDDDDDSKHHVRSGQEAKKSMSTKITSSSSSSKSKRISKSSAMRQVLKDQSEDEEINDDDDDDQVTESRKRQQTGKATRYEWPANDPISEVIREGRLVQYNHRLGHERTFCKYFCTQHRTGKPSSFSLKQNAVQHERCCKSEEKIIEFIDSAIQKGEIKEKHRIPRIKAALSDYFRCSYTNPKGKKCGRYHFSRIQLKYCEREHDMNHNLKCRKCLKLITDDDRSLHHHELYCNGEDRVLRKYSTERDDDDEANNNHDD